MYGAAALVPRPLNTYKLTKELREIITRTRNILQIKGQIDTKDPDDPHRFETKARIKKQAIYLVAKKIALVLRERRPGADYLNTPILHYLKQMHADITMKYQSNRYQRAEHLENEFNLEYANNNSNDGGIDLQHVFDQYDESDDEILAIVDEFNNQPIRRSRTRSRSRNRNKSRNKSRNRN